MPDQKTDNVVLIAGPTAAGKTALAIELARKIDGEIVNADSMQVYRDLQILSARPSAAEMALVPHHLFGVIDGGETCSAGRWARIAETVIRDITSRGKAAIVVGGTGLYFRALEEGLSPVPETPADVRQQARAHFDAVGAPAFQQEVVAFDPELGHLAQGDTQRLLRAWEVHHATGKPLSGFQNAPRRPLIDGVRARVILLPDREGLYRKCEARVDAMMEAGALEEAAHLRARGLDPQLPVVKALGAAELIAHLNGEMDLETAIDLTKRNTRRFVKRQLTWFRNQTPDWSSAHDTKSSLEILTDAMQQGNSNF